MIVIQILLTALQMLALPYLTGLLFMPAGKRGADGKVWTLAAGIMADYAVYECLALVCIARGGSFRRLTKLHAAVLCLLALLGVARLLIDRRRRGQDAGDVPPGGKSLRKGKNDEGGKDKNGKGEIGKWRPDPWLVIGICLILVQMGAILFWATPDKDDAFYSGLSSLCLMQDKVLRTDAYYGFLTQGLSRRYRFSALPAYQASLTLLSGGLHHLIISHNLFPLFYMPLAYALLFCIGKSLLQGVRSRGEDGKLLFAIGLLHMIGNYFVFSPENFLVTRIWQGKALFVTLGIPCIWHFTNLAVEGLSHAADRKAVLTNLRDWLLLAVTLFAVFFMGETGLYLGPFMTVCLGVAHGIRSRRIRHFLPMLICCIPEAVLLVIVLR